MIIRKEIDTSKPLTPEQIKMLEEEKVKALGKSSPLILSKLFEMAINNNDMLKQCM